jgi:hypothetical protein
VYSLYWLYTFFLGEYMSRASTMASKFGMVNGCPSYLGTISATTTAASFTTSLTPDCVVFVQPDADCYILVGAAASRLQDGSTVPTVTSSNGVKILADEKYFIALPDLDNSYGIAGQITPAIQAITSSGAASVRVFKLL